MSCFAAWAYSAYASYLSEDSRLPPLQVCGITCCGLVNFEQHCSSKKHLRKSAAVAGALSGASVMASDSTDTERNTTYVGLQAQCRSYCKQVISTELNRAVVELLQQLLFWQERAKSTSPYNLAKRKRLVSGLRHASPLPRSVPSAPCNCTACLCTLSKVLQQIQLRQAHVKSGLTGDLAKYICLVSRLRQRRSWLPGQWHKNVHLGFRACGTRREVAKAVRLRKACTVVVAPNIEHIEAEGGLDDLLTSILTQAKGSGIPIIFALSRKKLGQVSLNSSLTT